MLPSIGPLKLSTWLAPRHPLPEYRGMGAAGTCEESPEVVDALERDHPEALRLHHDIEGIARSCCMKPIE